MPRNHPNLEPLGFRVRDRREGILLATARAATRALPGSTTTAEIAAEAGVDERIVRQVVGDEETCILDACAWSVNRAFAVGLDAYDGPAEWPQKVQATILALTELLAPAEDIVALHTLVLPRLGDIGVQRAHAEREAFTAFLTPGFAPTEPDEEPLPSGLAEFVAGAVFELLATLATDHQIHELPEKAPDLIRVVLTPFCERDVIEALVEASNRGG